MWRLGDASVIRVCFFHSCSSNLRLLESRTKVKTGLKILQQHNSSCIKICVHSDKENNSKFKRSHGSVDMTFPRFSINLHFSFGHGETKYGPCMGIWEKAPCRTHHKMNKISNAYSLARLIYIDSPAWTRVYVVEQFSRMDENRHLECFMQLWPNFRAKMPR